VFVSGRDGGEGENGREDFRENRRRGEEEGFFGERENRKNE
jgi:hypothetical protein